MLAKLISEAPDRESAIRLLDRGLEEFHIAGPGTNIAFLRDLLKMPEFTQGTHNTAAIGVTYPEGWQAPTPTPQQQSEAVLARLLSMEQPGTDPWTSLGAWRVTELADRRGGALFLLEGENVQIEGRSGEYSITLPDHPPFELSNATLSNGTLCYEIDELRHNVHVHIDGDTVTLHGADGRMSIEVLTIDGILLSGSDGAAGAGNQVTAPMPGLVSEVITSVGDTVTAGQAVVVLEAMKLLQTLTAPCDGTVSQINFVAGENVDSGAVLISIEPEE